MSKEAFYSLLNRYATGKCTEEERRLVEQWYELLDDERVDLNEIELSAVGKRVGEALDGKIRDDVAKTRKMLRSRTILSIAACLTLLTIMLTYMISAPVMTPKAVAAANLVVAENKSGDPLRITLSDRTIVTLHAGSTLKYPVSFGNENREVSLEGEAFFEVTKDPSHPFVVFSNDLVTRVLGTSFTVRTKPQEVAVRSGKVSVKKNDGRQSLLKNLIFGRQEVTLLPNQHVTHDGIGDLSVSLVDNPLPLIRDDSPADAGRFIFENEALSSVLKELTDIYGVTFNVDENIISKCSFTGDLRGISMSTQLRFICRSTNLTYKIQGTTIQILGQGCDSAP